MARRRDSEPPRPDGRRRGDREHRGDSRPPPGVATAGRRGARRRAPGRPTSGRGYAARDRDGHPRPGGAGRYPRRPADPDARRRAEEPFQPRDARDGYDEGRSRDRRPPPLAAIVRVETARRVGVRDPDGIDPTTPVANVEGRAPRTDRPDRDQVERRPERGSDRPDRGPTDRRGPTTQRPTVRADRPPGPTTGARPRPPATTSRADRLATAATDGRPASDRRALDRGPSRTVRRPRRPSATAGTDRDPSGLGRSSRPMPTGRWPRPSASPRTRSWSPAAARWRRRSRRAARPGGCSSCPSDGWRWSSSCSTPRRCGSRWWRSKAAR